MAIATLSEEAVKNIFRQVEFYFSDSNLPRDTFLSKSISESDDGLVSLALICSFSRMKNHLGLDAAVKAEDISEETVSAVAQTLKKSSFLKLSEDGKRVGRSTELVKPEEVLEQVDIRTIAASPLEYNVKLEDVESFFGQHGKVNSVRLPRHVSDKRYFSGSALVEFSIEEDANNILNQSLVYAGVELELKSKKDFDAEREKQLEQFDNSRSSTDSKKRNGSHMNDNYPKDLIVAFKLKSMSEEGSAEQNGTHEAIDTVMDKKEEPNSTENTNEESEEKASENVKDSDEKSADMKEENGEKLPNSTKTINEESEKKASENVGDCEEKYADDVEKENGEKQPNSTKTINEESEEKASENVRDCEEKSADDIEKENGEKVQNSTKESEEKATEDAIQVNEEETTTKDPIQESKENITSNSFKENAKILREDLKNVFQRYGNVKYIDYKMGEESGYIRFERPEAAQKARAAAVLASEGGLIVKNYIASLEAVTGDAEREYWGLLRGNQERHREEIGNRGRGRNNRGWRHYRGKHPRSRESDSAGGRQNKVQKVSS